MYANAKSREGIDRKKVQVFLQVLMGGCRGVDAHLNEFTDFDPVALRALTNKVIEAILLDVDDCIARARGEILRKNILHLKKLLDPKYKLKFGILSNRQGSDRLKPLTDLGIGSYEDIFSKPYPESYLGACDQFRFNPKTTWMVGDRPATDGGCIVGKEKTLGGFALIKRIGGATEAPVTMMLQNAARQLEVLPTVFWNDKIITTEKIKAYYHQLVTP